MGEAPERPRDGGGGPGRGLGGRRRRRHSPRAAPRLSRRFLRPSADKMAAAGSAPRSAPPRARTLRTGPPTAQPAAPAVRQRRSGMSGRVNGGEGEGRAPPVRKMRSAPRGGGRPYASGVTGESGEKGRAGERRAPPPARGSAPEPPLPSPFPPPARNSSPGRGAAPPPPPGRRLRKVRRAPRMPPPAPPLRSLRSRRVTSATPAAQGAPARYAAGARRARPPPPPLRRLRSRPQPPPQFT